MPATPDLPAAVIEQAALAAAAAARAGAAAALPFFRGAVAVERKSDASPVTAADRAAEAAILKALRAQFPDWGVLSEEAGALGAQFPTRWIVDPLDGTRAFLRGRPSWGPLIALAHRGAIVAGAMALPVLERCYWAGRGLGCYRDGRRCRVSARARWEEAALSLGVLPRLLEPPYGAAVAELVRGAETTHSYGDGAGLALVLDGEAEAWLEAGVRWWDLAAGQVLVEEAGGRFSDFHGQPTAENGNGLASNGHVHEHVLYTLAARR